ncbi:MAG: UDP-N-acetylmuramoyl-tripeptide--D-alanyl-D-alanine ligase [Clostridia bacterium]|nr:UDP-N-acetylmuramoyl-tripeptide--D-alanyl-D-alanine ligase [Clostridia bacterium]
MYLGLKDSGMTLGEIAKITRGVPHNLPDGETYVYNIITDSRQSADGALFVALRGEKFDGHDFICQAYENGAVCVLTEKKIKTDKPFIIVKNTTAAYGDVAAAYRRKFKALAVAVTGSVGKTTTKEALCAVLGKKYKICKTVANHNNEIGLPETLLSLNASHQIAVVEMGMAARGEISALSEMAAPDISIITNVGTSHIEFLLSRENILKAKLEIADGMKPDGILLMNGDDDLLAGVKKTRTYAFFVGIDNPRVDFLASNVREMSDGMTFDMTYRGETLRDLHIPSLGKHSVYAALFAAAVGMICGLSESEIRAGLASYCPADMRQRISEKNGIKIIDDCYNASPESMRASIDVLKYININEHRRSVAVLGEMKELGKFSPSFHKAVGEYAKDKVDLLCLYGSGESIRAIKDGYDSGDRRAVMLGDDVDRAVTILKENVKSGDAILFKASRAVKLERLSEKMK